MNQVVYICSLSHSGSTALSLLLARHVKMVSLGEVESTYYQADRLRNVCTCGAKYVDCPFWGDISPNGASSHDVSGPDDFYLGIMERASRYAAEHDIRTLCDSSKTLSGLEQWRAFGDARVKVIFLVKDIRSYLLSQIERRANADKRAKDGARGLVLNRVPVLAFRWMASNTRIRRFLVKNDVDFLLLGYEELCLRTEQALDTIFRFLGLPQEELGSQRDRGRKDVHMIKGNKMRRNPEASASIYYDFRWMEAQTWLNLNAMPYLRVNNKLVYSNGFVDQG